MAKEQNTSLHRWFEEVWNNGRAELIDEMIAPNAIAHGLEDPNDTYLVKKTPKSASICADC